VYIYLISWHPLDQNLDNRNESTQQVIEKKSRIMEKLLKPKKTIQKKKKDPNKWTSDCRAQEILENMFKNGEIDPSERPAQVRKRVPEFIKYSSDVFRSHCNATKRREGLLGKYPLISHTKLEE
jgi:hypothetical protein